MVDTRERVLQLLRQGLSQAEIARELGISRPAVLKHVRNLEKAGLWKKNAPPAADPPPKPETKVDGKKAGRKPPPGPNRGSFKPGDPRCGAPRGNKNAVTTGEYETIFADVLDPDELELYVSMPTDAIRQAEELVRLLTIRERRMMRRIADLKAKADEQGMTVVEIIDEAGESDEKGRHRKKNFKRLGILGQIQEIEEALTRVQARKREAIDQLHRLRSEGGYMNNDKLEQLLEKMEAAARASLQSQTS